MVCCLAMERHRRLRWRVEWGDRKSISCLYGPAFFIIMYTSGFFEVALQRFYLPTIFLVTFLGMQ
jgi:hypothetical protein